MITQYEASSLLKEEIPQLDKKTYPVNLSLEIYASIHRFSDYTRHAVEDHDYSQAKKCFGLADRLYHHGDRLVKMLIENNFIYAFSSMLLQNRPDRLVVRSLIPARLYSVYLQQVMKTGC
ncbi:MAG: hypothetical protein ABW019_01150 [Chitinophagaceae bacterium]